MRFFMGKISNVFIISFFVLLVLSCSVKKDTFINRNYHSLTTKYNVLFNGAQAYEMGLQEIRDNHQDNFWKRLPIEPITFDDKKIAIPVLKPGVGMNVNEEEEELTENATNFDKAEEKAVKAIQMHSMNIEGYEKNKQIDNAYLLLGKARYYTQRFIPAIEAFNYIIANYPKANLIYETKIWRAKANIRIENENLAIESLKLLLEVDKNEKSLTDLQREEAYTALAMAYEKTDSIQKVIESLTLASRTFQEKEQAARNQFILGQIYSEQDKRDSARMVFNQLADQKKAPFKYRIRANIELAKNTENDSASVLVLSRIKKLIRNTDNRKFLNALYYQAGVLELGRDNVDKAAVYFEKSLRAKVNTNYQKTYAYEQLGNMAFDKQNYVLAGSYYDSVLSVTSKEFDQEKRIRRIRRKNKGLTTLRTYEELVATNDSILQLVAMSDTERTTYFQDYIKKIQKQDEENRQQLLNSQNFGSSFGGSMGAFGNPSKKGKWYFYNTQSISFGKAEFERVWGNRPLADNWRFSDTGVVKTIDNTVESNELDKDPRYELSTYLSAIPTNPESIAKLTVNRNDALYQLGLIYKEQFKNPELAISNFERVRELRKDKDLELAINYQLHQLYEELGDTEKAKYHKDIVVNQYPDSQFAKVLLSPNAEVEMVLSEEDEVVKAYKAVYYLYKLDKHESAIENIDKLTSRYKNSNLIPKLALLKALCIGKLENRENYKESLHYVATTYENTEEGTRAEELLKQLEK